MPQATETPTTPTRRLALRFGATAALAGLLAPAAARAASADDAELLELCRQFFAVHRVIDAWNAGEVDWDTGEAAHVHWGELLAKLTKVPARTPEGLRAKAHAALVAMETLDDEETGYVEEAAAMAALADLVRGAGA